MPRGWTPRPEGLSAVKGTEVVEAGEVEAGDFLPGLDNGYVFEDPTQADAYVSDGYVIAMPSGTIRIRFHTAEGEEAELICPDNMPVTIRQR